MKRISNPHQADMMADRILVLTKEDTREADSKIDRLLKQFKTKKSLMMIALSFRPHHSKLDNMSLEQLRITIKRLALDDAGMER